MRRRHLAVVIVAGVTVAVACGGDDDDDARTQIELFQFKGEAVDIFGELVADFEAEHPDIDVVLNNVPNADAAIRTRLVRDDVPDVMTLNGSGNFAQLARADVFYDFAGEPVLDTVNPAIVKILTDLGTSGEGEVNGVPFANNADGVIYNKDLFAEHGLEPPTTWDEMIEVADAFEAEGIAPFYITLREAWTSLPAWNALASNLPPEDFWPKVDDGETSFQDDYQLVAERMTKLFSYGQEDKFSRGYEDGNRAFAEGNVPMYLQGIWAITAIRDFNPEFEIGTFALPMDTPEDTRARLGRRRRASTMPKEPEHPEASLALIEYLMRPEVVDKYVTDQAAIPTLTGVLSEDPALEGLLPYFEELRLVGFTDHQIPASIPLQQINQSFLIDGDQDAYLSQLDKEWDKFVDRRPEREDR